MAAALDPLSPSALLTPPGAAANDVSGSDWVDEVQANSASWGRYELVFDEATGQYELKDLAAEATPAEAAAPEQPASQADEAITLEPGEEGEALLLAGWASLAGPTGPSAFHTPYYWSPALNALADLAAIPALAESRCGAAWPARLAA